MNTACIRVHKYSHLLVKMRTAILTSLFIFSFGHTTHGQTKLFALDRLFEEYAPVHQTGLNSSHKISGPESPTERFPRMIYARREGDAQMPFEGYTDSRSRTQCGVPRKKTPYIETEELYSHGNPFIC
ncbi:hypothetical protein CRM22_005157 [Opisthorchis felineus]|uniref:Uncharacterized protein n=1 Tax=Opisthorchis felineus TaxID=147828 RepID=A0A4S2LZK6_OPIFE|nr:hypothetical protein CRM22_005157 [Opisthorchis felineus]